MSKYKPYYYEDTVTGCTYCWYAEKKKWFLICPVDKLPTKIHKYVNVEKEQWYTHQLTQEQLRLFIEEAHTGKNNKKAFIGNVTPDATQRIEAVCGKRVKYIMLESGAIRHSYGKDYHLLEKEDIFHYVDVVNTATDIQFSRKKHLNNDVITFTKDINGKILFAVEVRVKHDGWLSLITCYRLHKKR